MDEKILALGFADVFDMKAEGPDAVKKAFSNNVCLMIQMVRPRSINETSPLSLSSSTGHPERRSDFGAGGGNLRQSPQGHPKLCVPSTISSTPILLNFHLISPTSLRSVAQHGFAGILLNMEAGILLRIAPLVISKVFAWRCFAVG